MGGGGSRNKKIALVIAGISYFPDSRRNKYHRPATLALLCSEWEEVGHVAIKHQQTQRLFFPRTFCGSATRLRCIQQSTKGAGFSTLMIGLKIAQRITQNLQPNYKRATRFTLYVLRIIHRLFRTYVRPISNSRLKLLRALHLNPINVVIFHGSLPFRTKCLILG